MSDPTESERERRARVLAWVRAPVTDYLGALDRALAGAPGPNALLLVLSLAAAWWVYVPVHELLHVAGCVLSGGTVSRLDLEPIYGAALLRQVFPFIEVGSEYAGQLSGFDTRGSDLIYLATDAAPFMLTIVFGIPLVRWVAHRELGGRRSAVLFGVAMPFAYSPLISLTGDYYEMGSIVVSRLMTALDPSFALERIRGDDVGLVVERLTPATPQDIVGVIAALLLGVLLALLTYGGGRLLSPDPRPRHAVLR